MNKKNLLIMGLILISEIMLCFAMKNKIAVEIAKSHMDIDFTTAALGLVLVIGIFSFVIYPMCKSRGKSNIIMMIVIGISVVVCCTYIGYIISNTPCSICDKLY